MKKSLFILFLFAFLQTYSQQYSYRHYTIFDGLPQNQITDLYLDDDHFLWIGTKGGICRFDGEDFVHYTSSGSANNHVRGIFSVKDTLYYYTSRDLFQMQDGAFKKIFTSEKESIMYIFWAQEENGFIVNTNHAVSYFRNGPVEELYRDDEHELRIFGFISKEKFLLWLENVKLYKVDTLGVELIRDSVHLYNDIFRQNNKDVYFGVNLSFPDTLFRYNSKEETSDIVFISEKESITNCYILDKDIIAGTQIQNWFRLNDSLRIIDADSLPDAGIRGLVEYNNTLFIGTEVGLFVRNSAAFVNYTYRDNIPKQLWSVFEDSHNDIILASFFGKLLRIKENKVEGEIPLNIRDYSFQYPYSFYMGGLALKNGKWAIPMSVGLFYGNASEQRLISDRPDSFCSFCTYEDTLSNLLYLGSPNGVYIFDIAKEMLVKNIQTDGVNVLDIAKDKYGRLWFCTSKKVFLYEGDTLNGIYKKQEELHQPFVSCCPDAKGNMWLANKKGLYLYNYDSLQKVWDGSFTFINNYKKTHIIAGNTFGVLYLNLDDFYAGEKDFAYFFDRFNGFIGKECGQNGSCVDSQNNVWIPTSESVVKFMPEKIYIDTIPPKTYISSMDVSGRNLNWAERDKYPINSDSIYKLQWDKNNIKIYFHSIKYHCPERVKYRYRLLGYSENWSEVAENEALFTNLEPGHYTFELIAANEYGYWSASPTRMQLEIVPAFWQMLVFKIAFVLIAGGLLFFALYLYFRRKQRNEKQRQKAEQQLVQVQLNSLNSQLDPHFVFNALSAISVEVLTNNTQQAYDYFVKATRLFRSSLVDRESVTRTLEKEIQVVEGYLELQQLRFGDRVKYQLHIDKNVDDQIVVPKLSIQVFVENAVKHGLEAKPDGGHVNISIAKHNAVLYIEIEDNGIGRKASSQRRKRSSTGLGLKSFRHFFEILNKVNTQKAGFFIEDLFDAEGEPKGTKVRVEIPLDYRFSVD